MRNQYFMTFFLLFIVACSTDRTKNTTPETLLDESSEDIVEEVVIEVDEDIYSEIEQIEKSSEFSRLDTIYDNSETLVAHNQRTKEDIVHVLTQDFEDYTIKKGDSLMLISYKLLGDYRKWKMFEQWNDNIPQDASAIKPGQVIRYDTAYVEDQGLARGYPYLILRGDNLQKISHKVYDDKGKHWKSIYHNNRNLIFDPNVIFAGFTLYYLPFSDLAENRLPANQ